MLQVHAIGAEVELAFKVEKSSKARSGWDFWTSARTAPAIAFEVARTRTKNHAPAALSSSGRYTSGTNRCPSRVRL
jgi:hypothetical protein